MALCSTCNGFYLGLPHTCRSQAIDVIGQFFVSTLPLCLSPSPGAVPAILSPSLCVQLVPCGRVLMLGK